MQVEGGNQVVEHAHLARVRAHNPFTPVMTSHRTTAMRTHLPFAPVMAAAPPKEWAALVAPSPPPRQSLAQSVAGAGGDDAAGCAFVPFTFIEMGNQRAFVKQTGFFLSLLSRCVTNQINERMSDAKWRHELTHIPAFFVLSLLDPSIT